MKTRSYLCSVVSGAIACAAFTAPWITQGQVIFSCPFTGFGGDFLDRGFYVQNYPGDNLGTVQLRYSSGASGTYVVSMTARLGTYDGPIIGNTEVATFYLTGSLSDQTAVTYDFEGIPVPFGSTVTFSQSFVSGPNTLHYDVGTGPCLGIVETEGTSSPLDVFRRDSVGVIITQVPEPTSFLLLCAGFGGLWAYLTSRMKRLV